MSTSELKLDNIVFKHADILEADEQYICQQCNCTSANYKGLSKAIVETFPWATFYSEARKPGTIGIKGNGKDKRFVIGMFEQRYISFSKYANDTEDMRLIWFKGCLEDIAKIPEIKSIAIPHKLGCGLAGGD